MPYPILLAVAGAMSAAGAGMNMAANAETADAMRKAREAERLRQQGYEKKAVNAWEQSLDQSGRSAADKSLAEGEAQRVNAYNRMSQVPLSTQTAPVASAAGPKMVRTPAAATQASLAAVNNAWTKLRGQSRAALGSYGDWGVANYAKNRSAQDELGIASALARGSANVLPLEMEAASRAGDELRGWGSAVGAVGQIAGTAAASGYGGGGGWEYGANGWVKG